METTQFDTLTRSYAVAPSRRRFVRSGVGALAASALAAVGLSRVQPEADARRKRCRSVGLKQVCGSNSACCPGKTGTICSWNYCRSDDLAVCCKPAGGSCLYNCDCCGQYSFCNAAGVCE
jgi:hypothetical protein